MKQISRLVKRKEPGLIPTTQPAAASEGEGRSVPITVVVVMRSRAFMLSPVVYVIRDAQESRCYRAFLNELPFSLLASENLSLDAIRPYDTERTLLYTELNPGAGNSFRLFETCFLPSCQ
jgi:hypothetical protein